jgi:hypothetical protein
MIAIMANLQSEYVSSSDSINIIETTLRSQFESLTSLLVISGYSGIEILEKKQEESSSNNGVFAASLLDGGNHHLLSTITKLSS